MVIKIDNSIIEYIKREKTAICTDEVIMALNSLIKSFVTRQHIVFAEVNDLEYLEECNLVEEINRKAIQWLLQRYYTIGNFVSITPVKIIAFYDKENEEISRRGNTFFVPIKNFVTTYCTQLLTENSMDTYFYLSIANEVNNKYLKLADLSIAYDGRPYCGGNVETVTREVMKKFNIALCIVDTDKDYRHDNDGSTLVQAKSVVGELKENHVIDLYPLKVREKENLLPPLFYLRFLNYASGLLQILNHKTNEKEELLRFIDIKDGIKAKKCIEAGNEWKELYWDFLTECEEQGVLKCSLEEIPNKDENFIVLNGISGDAVETVRRNLFEDGAENVLYKMKKNGAPEKNINEQIEKVKLSKVVFENLPDYLKQDWIELGTMIFGWCCRITDEEMFVFG